MLIDGRVEMYKAYNKQMKRLLDVDIIILYAYQFFFFDCNAGYPHINGAHRQLWFILKGNFTRNG